MEHWERFKEELAAESPVALLLEGFDEAIVGVGRRCGKPSLAIYDQAKIIAILERTMPPVDAFYYYEFNIASAWMGENTPIIMQTVPGEGWDA